MKNWLQPPPSPERRAFRWCPLNVCFWLLCLGLTLNLLVSSCGAGESGGAEKQAAPRPSAEALKQKWGIQLSSVFLSGGGNMVDFRYRVLDPGKAAALTKVDLKPTLIEQKSGAKLSVPTTPKVGPLRQTTRQPVAGKTYFMLFANTRHRVKHGDKVTITMGDFKVEDLNVE